MLTLICSLVLLSRPPNTPPFAERQVDALLEHHKDREDDLTSDFLQRAVHRRDSMRPALRPPRQFNPLSENLSGAWEFIGPNNLDTASEIFAGPSPVSGRMNAVAIDPFTQGTYYAGSGNGGFWKTTDGGTHWTCLSDDWSVPKVSSIATDWAHPGTIYVGTGDIPGGGHLAMGIMKTIDGGGHWDQIGQSEFGTNAVAAIAVDPTDADIVLAATQGTDDPPDTASGRIWRSGDGGSTWHATTLPTAYWNCVVASARHLDGFADIYVSCGYPIAQVWRSHDQGLTWSQITTLPALPNRLAVVIATSPITPSNAYLLAMAANKVYKTDDAGFSWHDCTPPSSFFWTQEWYTWCIACSGLDANDVVYVGDYDIAQSLDNGDHWNIISGPITTSPARIHVDQHAIAVDPNFANHLLVGNDGGVYNDFYFPVGDFNAFSSLNATLGVTEFYGASVDPLDPTRIVGGSQDNGNPFADGDLTHWHCAFNGDGQTGLINPYATNLQYVEKIVGADPVVYRTSTDWASVGNISPSFPDDPNLTGQSPLVMDPNVPVRIYMAGQMFHVWSEVFGIWSTPSTQPLSRFFSVSALTVAPGHSNRLFTGDPQGQVWMSDDAGGTWTEVDGGAIPLPHDHVTDISVDPSDDNDLLVSLSSIPGSTTPQLWRCTNVLASTATRVWRNVNGSGSTGLPQIPIRTIARDIDSNETVHWFVGTSIGVFETPDGGGTWLNATNPLNLPNVRVNKLQSIPASQYLVATTFGRGMWRIPLIASGMGIGMMSIDPSSMSSGMKGIGKVLLTAPAGKSGALVPLDCKFDGVALPRSIMIQPGEISGTFEFSATNSTGKKVKTEITAYGIQPVSAQLTILPIKK